MTDLYTQLVSNPVGERLARQVGLPRPTALERFSPGDRVVSGTVLLGGAAVSNVQAPASRRRSVDVRGGGRLVGPIARVLAGAGADVASELEEPVRSAVADAGLDAAVWNPEAPGEHRFKALVFDATGIADSIELVALHAFFHPTVRRLSPSGRVVVLGTPPSECSTPREATAQRALEGFTRALGKEVGGGSAVQLVYVAPGGEAAIGSTLRFLLSARSAYVSGQVVRVGAPVANGPGAEELDWKRPLAGQVALITGASRGIGLAIVRTFARDGATVTGLDVPAMGEELREAMQALGGTALPLDLTADEAPEQIAETFPDGLDVIVHNAGVTKDRTLAKMPEDRWSSVIDINLSSEERINDVLLEAEVLRPNGRIVCVSSLSGIAGNGGQTNYATSKAGVIGMVEALAPVVAERAITINAVAPGFIETQMTAAMPVAIREAGRRMNSMSQGGLPVDVAEAIAWFASPASGGLNGNVVGVGGQTLLGT